MNENLLHCIGNFEGSSWKSFRNRANHFGDKIKQDVKNEMKFGDESVDRNDILDQSNDKATRTALFIAFLLSTGIFAGILFSSK